MAKACKTVLAPHPNPPQSKLQRSINKKTGFTNDKFRVVTPSEGTTRLFGSCDKASTTNSMDWSMGNLAGNHGLHPQMYGFRTDFP